MFAAASSFFARTNISQNYNIGTAATSSRSATPTSGTPSGPSSSLPVAAARSPAFHVGLWRVQSASHKVTNKRVSVWSFDKRSPEMERLTAIAKEHTLSILKAEASALSRLRHPCILEMVEPLEETRNELIFATEPLISSLQLSIPGSSRSTLVELDEVEIQKGILQLCKGLAFLHTSARLIHTNINPESILINTSGDWKISGLGLTIPLQKPDGSETRWEFPTFDGRAPSHVQRSFDYMAPEYALDELLVTESDMYSLGCLIYAVHCKGSPPFRNHGSLSGLRDNAGKPLSGIDRLDRDLQALLTLLLTRHPQGRPTPTDLPTHSFFSSLPISTLNFLDRSNFTAKSKEEKISFMKGLTNVLDRFSEGLRVRKILPTLLEEMKDTQLLPYILPNVFAISATLTPTQFASTVLPSLKPLFAIKEPPQNMLTLLDNLKMLQSKTEKSVFREHVLPLVYNALESEHAIVQERALNTVPDLCETIDYAEVQGVLFPRVALVFSKTRILSVKVATLNTFLSMVKTLDQASLTQKLVPLLSKIRTKEPAVMMATLAIQEAMGTKVDHEAIASLILPHLFTMSMGPLLNITQFQRFMCVIRKLTDRVEKEHNQFLRDSQRIEDHSVTAVNGNTSASTGATIDFESLVGKANGAAVKPDTVLDTSSADWGDDVWGSLLTSPAVTPKLPAPAPVPQPQSFHVPLQVQSVPSSPKFQSPLASTSLRSGASHISSVSSRGLGVTPIPPTSFSSAAFSAPTRTRSSLSMSTQLMQPMQANHTGGYQTTPSQAPSKPNYNISLDDIMPGPTMSPPIAPVSLQQPMQMGAIIPSASPPPLSMSSPPLLASPPTMSGMLAPSRPAQPTWSSQQSKNVDWGDFDPLA
ncbi:kinase-like protein [Neolentinus lepideus HHB14362 ss-1]|uniref:Kinase-like protein n=1 Tax=Neolentinus lepideus HHB14362 ss-1 TaxID=1314782 RepID=A0A165TDD9_9AGAM|nr:kinase-like protein [Neolentinus lepideus HHB14362 ss-1]